MPISSSQRLRQLTAARAAMTSGSQIPANLAQAVAQGIAYVSNTNTTITQATYDAIKAHKTIYVPVVAGLGKVIYITPLWASLYWSNPKAFPSPGDLQSGIGSIVSKQDTANNITAALIATAVVGAAVSAASSTSAGTSATVSGSTVQTTGTTLQTTNTTLQSTNTLTSYVTEAKTLAGELVAAKGAATALGVGGGSKPAPTSQNSPAPVVSPSTTPITGNSTLNTLMLAVAAYFLL